MVENPLEYSNAIRLLVSLNQEDKTFSQLLIEAKIIPSTLDRRLKQLQKLGLIEKRKLGNAKREGVIYSLTNKGKRLLAILNNN